MKEMIESVFSSMRDDEKLYEKETNFVRKRFYEVTKQPLKMEVGEDWEHKAYSIVRSSIHDFVGMFFLSNVKEYNLTVASLKPLMVKGSLTVEYSYMNWDKEEVVEGIKKEYTFKKPIKLSKLFLSHMQPDMMLLYKLRYKCDESSVYLDKEAYLAKKAEVLSNNINHQFKRVKTLLEDRPIWVYFTNNDYGRYYADMNKHLKLSSCMTYGARCFGSSYNGEFQHPLDGYSYSPDFRLALFSFLSPDEIKETTDYPFIGRSVVFPAGANRFPNIAYAKVYGNEILAGRMSGYITNIENPIGCVFYGVVCDGYNGNQEEEGGHNDLYSKYWLERDNLHIIAPYIDHYNNAFVLKRGTPFIRQQDCKLVVELEVVMPNDDDDDENQRKPYLSMHYSTGIVQYTYPDDEILEFWYDNEKGQWNID